MLETTDCNLIVLLLVAATSGCTAETQAPPRPEVPLAQPPSNTSAVFCFTQRGGTDSACTIGEPECKAVRRIREEEYSTPSTPYRGSECFPYKGRTYCAWVEDQNPERVFPRCYMDEKACMEFIPLIKAPERLASYKGAPCKVESQLRTDAAAK
jgi:hypothetical protein